MRNLAVLKYPLQQGGNTLTLPRGCKVLDMQCQRGQLQLWVLGEPDAVSTEVAVVVVVGTGHPLPAEGFAHAEYVATAQQGDYLVWHAFITRRAR